jgi:hypothetical protein
MERLAWVYRVHRGWLSKSGGPHPQKFLHAPGERSPFMPQGTIIAWLNAQGAGGCGV